MKPEELEARLKEYDTLREESIATHNLRPQVFALGVAGLGGLLGGVLAIGHPDQGNAWRVVLAATCIGVPTLSLSVLLVWLGELERMVRLGTYIADRIERPINESFGTAVLGWEVSLRDQRMYYPYVAPAGFLGAAALAGPFLGSHLIGHGFLGLGLTAGGSLVGSILVGIYAAWRAASVWSGQTKTSQQIATASETGGLNPAQSATTGNISPSKSTENHH